MTEKEMFLNSWQQEFGRTMKVLKQMPEEKASYRPAADKARSGKEIAAVMIQELGVVDGVVKGKVDFSGAMPSFSTYGDLLKALEGKYKEMVPKVQAMSDADWNAKVTAPVGPKQMGEVRRADMLWLMLHDSIHHRGQFSIYLRLVGAKVPSIYGPSGDEPWM
jgi:uncharacterized damage-inducible protein DinB